MTNSLVNPSVEAVGENGFSARLVRFIESECGAGTRVVNLAAMEDGHAGLTFGFEVIDVAGRSLGAYVIKLAPLGVARRGNTDVYRQAPLLHGLKSAGMPVPAVAFASPTDNELGTPFIVMERLPGRVFLVWEPHPSFLRDQSKLRDVWLQASRMLARLHNVDWQAVLSDWEKPRPLRDELDFWTPLLRHALDSRWQTAGMELGGLLAARIPDPQPVGVVHGDFQPGNILYVDGQAKALIDWELASIGSQGLDVGWLLMMSDPQAWDPSWRPVAQVSREDLVGAYVESGGTAQSNLDWYQALAHYRLGAIACLNVKLHRTAKRTDILWEHFASSIPALFARGLELTRRAVSK